MFLKNHGEAATGFRIFFGHHSAFYAPLDFEPMVPPQDAILVLRITAQL